MSQDAWFYTREGEKIGPVTLAELRIKSKEGELNPRLDMAWVRGMDTWKPLGEIDGLFERRSAPEPQENLAPEAGPYTPPTQETAAERMGRESGWPGARRRSFIISSILISLWGSGYPEALKFLQAQFGPHITQFAAPAIGLAPVLIYLYFNLNRLVNLGMSRWWLVGFSVPFLGFWVGFRCFACPGGYAYHKKLDGAGIFLAIVYWLLLALGLAASVLVTAVYLGMMGTPEDQEQVRDVLRQVVSGSFQKP